GGFNIGALEKDKDMIVDIKTSSNYESVSESLGSDWEKQPEAMAKDGVITLEITDNTNIKASEKPAEPVEAKDPNKIEVYLNGEKMSFDSEPYIEKGTTRVPMRAIFEGLGAAVDFEPEEKVVTAVKGDTKIELAIGSNTALINGEENELIVPAEIKNSRTMVPLRFVSEALGAKVDWDGETKTITITSEAADEKPAEVKEESIAGVYVQTIKEEMGGEEYEFKYSITLNDDKTGVMSIQDEIKFTWDDENLVSEDGTKYAYTVKDGVLTVDFNGNDSVFTKA
ncbi:MAG: hypothetical protein IJR45_02860, partial [Firmicutes bacterium]|nr:hypothetical protein [Bacillota bacterium]